MFYVSEEVFIDKFIACIKLKDLSLFPFDTDDFYNGVEKMSLVFQQNRTDLGKDADEISLLFVKNPIEGVYSRFRDAISEQNGSSVSFENPQYVEGKLKLSEKDANEIMEKEEISVPNEYIKRMADAFCLGAGL